MKLSMNFQFFVVYDNNYSIVVYGGDIIRFPLFLFKKALNNNLEVWFLYMFIFMPHQIFWWRVGPSNSDVLNWEQC